MSKFGGALSVSRFRSDAHTPHHKGVQSEAASVYEGGILLTAIGILVHLFYNVKYNKSNQPRMNVRLDALYRAVGSGLEPFERFQFFYNSAAAVQWNEYSLPSVTPLALYINVSDSPTVPFSSMVVRSAVVETLRTASAVPVTDE